MGRLVEWAKNHKTLAVSLAAGLILLLWLWQRNAASAAAAQPSQATGPDGLTASEYASIQQAEIQSGAQLSSQQLAANVATAQTAAQLQAQQTQYATALQIAQLQQQEGLYNTYAAAGVQSEGITTGGAVQLAQISANQTVSLAQIQASEQLTQSQLSLSQTLANILAGNPGGNTYVPSSATPPTPQVVSSGTSPTSIPINTYVIPAASPQGPASSSPLYPLLPGSTATVPAVSAPVYSAPNLINPPSPSLVMTDSLIAYDQAQGMAYASTPAQQAFPGANPYFAQQQTLSNLPGVQQIFSSESAAINAGALVENAQGQFVPAIPGAQISY